MASAHTHRFLSLTAWGVGVGLLALVVVVGSAGGADEASSQAKASLNKGLQAFKKGRLPEAAKAFERAADLDPTNPITSNNLGLTYIRMGRARDAIDSFERAVALRPTSPTFHYNLARACHLAKNYPKAIEHYQKTLALDPAHPLAHLHLGKLYGREQQRYPEAIDALSKAIALNADDTNARYLPEAHYLLAVAYYGVKNFPLSWKSVREAERLGYDVNPAFLKALRQVAPEPPK